MDADFCTLPGVKKLVIDRIVLACSAPLLLAMSVACSKKTSEPASAEPTKATQVATSAAKPTTAPVAKAPQPAALGIEWTDPAGWKKTKPTSMMRKASYEIPAAAGDTSAAELVVFYFGPGQGGGVEANMKRWSGQFGDVEKKSIVRTERSANDLTQHIIEIEKGTYTNRMGPHAAAKGSQKEHGLLGAVVEAPTGAYFFKLTGPSKTVKAARDDFFKLLDSTKAKSK